jgi:oligoendopeptidase F
MKEKGHLDLDSRIGKAPGGYNYPLYQSSLPFIFMNSAGTMRDMVTMMHEGGHAVHSWLSKDLNLTAYKSTPSEIAEVASMAMELISMEHWDVFFEDESTLRRARKYQLEKILSILPWIATVDAFQHWLYLHPEHSPEERKSEWIKLFRKVKRPVTSLLVGTDSCTFSKCHFTTSNMVLHNWLQSEFGKTTKQILRKPCCSMKQH